MKIQINFMNILSFSDIHLDNKTDINFYINKITINLNNQIDMFVFCGDILRNNIYYDIVNKLLVNIFKTIDIYKIYFIFGNNDGNNNDNPNNTVLNNLKNLYNDSNLIEQNIVINKKYITKQIKEFNILLTCYSESFRKSTNIYCQSIDLEKLKTEINKADIILSHGTFKLMSEFTNKIFIFGHHHISGEIGLYNNNIKHNDYPLSFFKYKDNYYINVSTTIKSKHLLTNRETYLNLICINCKNKKEYKDKFKLHIYNNYNEIKQYFTQEETLMIE
jgi:predicted phosphodiesterase